MSSIKRKRFLIDRKLQFTIIGVFVLAVFIALLLFTAASAGFYWFSGMSGENLFKEYLTIHRQVVEEQEIESEGQMVVRQVTATKLIPGVKRWELIVPAIIVNNLILLVVISVIGIIYTNRIAGPLYRIRKDLEKVLEGEEDVKLTIRKRDTMGELVKPLNTLIEELYASRRKRK